MVVMYVKFDTLYFENFHEFYVDFISLAGWLFVE